MISLGLSIVLFLPVFLAVNLVAAVPGQQDLRVAMRQGFKHFVFGTVIILVGSFSLHLLMIWLISRPSLW